MDYLWLNGQLLPTDDARIAPSDAGFLHGAGLFETMRAKAGKVFRLRQHLDRLTASARALGIAVSLSESDLAEMVGELLEANSLRDARLRLTVTRGDLSQATPEAPEPPLTLALTATTFTGYPAAMYEKGMTVVISPYKQNPENPLSGHKTTSYFDRLLALRDAQKAGAGEALWFTPHNETLAEGSISNVFILDKDGLLATPPLTVKQMLPDGKSRDIRLCLPGITRQAVLEIATELQMLPHQRAITIDDLLAAREVFLTNAIMGIMPVVLIERHLVGSGRPGTTTTKLREAYEKKVAAECG